MVIDRGTPGRFLIKRTTEALTEDAVKVTTV